jgi:hypothetical protein
VVLDGQRSREVRHFATLSAHNIAGGSKSGVTRRVLLHLLKKLDDGSNTAADTLDEFIKLRGGSSSPMLLDELLKPPISERRAAALPKVLGTLGVTANKNMDKVLPRMLRLIGTQRAISGMQDKAHSNIQTFKHSNTYHF